MSTLIERCYACNERVDSIGRCYNHRCENYRGKEAAPTPFRQGLTKEPCSLHDGLNCMARCNCTLASNQVFQPSIESKIPHPAMKQSVADFLNSIIHLPYKEQTDAIGLFLMAQEEALSTATQERDQLKESLLRLIEAERQFRFCGTPEMKTVDDVITGMRNIGDKLQSVVLAAELKEARTALRLADLALSSARDHCADEGLGKVMAQSYDSALVGEATLAVRKALRHP